MQPCATLSHVTTLQLSIMLNIKSHLIIQPISTFLTSRLKNNHALCIKRKENASQIFCTCPTFAWTSVLSFWLLGHIQLQSRRQQQIIRLSWDKSTIWKWIHNVANVINKDNIQIRYIQKKHTTGQWGRESSSTSLHQGKKKQCDCNKSQSVC